MSSAVVKAKLTRELSKLGKSPEVIAARLQKLGITGQRDRILYCPIWRYLIDRGFDFVAVSRAGVSAKIGKRFAVAHFPAHMVLFLWEFDDGLHPALIAPSV